MNKPKKNKVTERVVPEVPAVPVVTKIDRYTFRYPVPETKEDLLALHKCLQDTGVNSIGDLEVKASRL